MAKTIFGAGNSAANPVKLQVLCEDKRAMIPFIIKNEDKSDVCDTKITFEDHRHEVTFTDSCDCRSKIECGKYADYDKKTGSFTYDGLTVYYELELITDPCQDTPQCVTSCSVGNYWMTKSDDNLLVSYEKYTIKDCGDYADVKKEIKHQTVTCSTDDITISDECGSFTFKYECPTGCTGSGSTVINIRGTSFTPLFVEYTGGKVNVLISYEKIVTDENCNEHKTRGSVILEAEVKPCEEQLINMCCFDHSADVEILKTDLLKALGIEGAAATGVIVNYKGEEIAYKLILSIMQKANPGPECNKDCNYVTTYCVLEDGTHIIKVEYETYWGSRVWITKEAGGKISSAGGRVRISFDYIATAIAVDEDGFPITNKQGQKIDHSGNTIVDKEGNPIMEDICKPYEYNGSDNVIIEVGPCSGEEIEVDCGTTVTILGDILYKDRSSWCDETEHVKPYTYTDIISHEEFVMNQITYEVEQDCSGVCDPGEYIVYEPIDLNIDKCATLAEGDVPWKKIKVDENCLVTTAETGTEHIVIQVEPNQTTEPIIFTNEYFRITQAAGPCDEGLSCGCDAVKILSGEYPDVCDEPDYVFETVNITCKEHDMVEVPFKGYCNGVAVYEGKYKWEHYFACNSGTGEIIYTKDVNGGQIKVVQDGGCTSCGEPPTPPVVTCEAADNAELNGYISAFTATVGTNITYTDTPCTYKYLSDGLEYVNEKYNNDYSKMFMIANILSELTPYTEMASEYFYNAIQKVGFDPDNLTSSISGTVSEAVERYEDMNNGAIAYAQFKNSNFDEYNELAEKARAELQDKNVRLAALRNEDPLTTEFSNSEVVHAAVLNEKPEKCFRVDYNMVGDSIRIVPSGSPSYDGDSYDYEYTYDYIHGLEYKYDSVEKVKDVNEEGKYQPLKDKYHCKEYFAEILGLNNDSTTFIEKLSNYSSKENDRLKCTYWRHRPNLVMASAWANAQNCSGATIDLDGVYGVFLSDNSKRPIKCSPKSLDSDLSEYAIGGGNTYCINKCYLIGPKSSFPSGHSALAFLELLGCLEKYGDTISVEGYKYTSRITRMTDYCENRVIVRAHWKTDTVIGKLTSAIQIGFLNGFSKFLEYAKPGSGPTPPPTPTECDGSNTSTGDFGYYFGGSECQCNWDGSSVCQTDCERLTHDDVKVEVSPGVWVFKGHQPDAREPQIKVNKKVNYKIISDGYDISVNGPNGDTAGTFNASTNYVVYCAALPQGKEKTVQFMLCNQSESKTINYHLISPNYYVNYKNNTSANISGLECTVTLDNGDRRESTYQWIVENHKMKADSWIDNSSAHTNITNITNLKVNGETHTNFTWEYAELNDGREVIININ